jgi:RNase H-like domain found in reverse transcriptase
VGWSQIHKRAFQKCKESLASHFTLSHPRLEKAVCVFTDASLDFWGSDITQINVGELDLPFSEQNHSPLAFLSRSFKNAASRWPIVEKEAFAIVETVCLMEYLLMRPGGFHLFTDHRNLQYIFNPYGHNPGVQRHVVAKLERWSIKLMSFDYVVEHILGEDNVWGDLLSRWGAGISSAPVLAIRAVLQALVAPLFDCFFKLPKRGDLSDAQAAFPSEIPEFLCLDDDGVWRDANNRIWVPTSALILQL